MEALAGEEPRVIYDCCCNSYMIISYMSFEAGGQVDGIYQLLTDSHLVDGGTDSAGSREEECLHEHHTSDNRFRGGWVEHIYTYTL